MLLLMIYYIILYLTILIANFLKGNEFIAASQLYTCLIFSTSHFNEIYSFLISQLVNFMLIALLMFFFYLLTINPFLFFTLISDP